jgi:hypothetical protein
MKLKGKPAKGRLSSRWKLLVRKDVMLKEGVYVKKLRRMRSIGRRLGC